MRQHLASEAWRAAALSTPRRRVPGSGLEFICAFAALALAAKQTLLEMALAQIQAEQRETALRGELDLAQAKVRDLLQRTVRENVRCVQRFRRGHQTNLRVHRMLTDSGYSLGISAPCEVISLPQDANYSPINSLYGVRFKIVLRQGNIFTRRADA